MIAAAGLAILALMVGVLAGAGLVWWWWREATASQLDYWMEWKAEVDAQWAWPPRPDGSRRGYSEILYERWAPEGVAMFVYRGPAGPRGRWRVQHRMPELEQMPPLTPCKWRRAVVH